MSYFDPMKQKTIFLFGYFDDHNYLYEILFQHRQASWCGIDLAD